MILSASGWRKVFAASGDEEDSTAAVSPEDKALTAAAAAAFHSFLQSRNLGPDKGTRILIGRDSRPTGAQLEELFCAYLNTLGYSIAATGIIAAPEIMAAAAEDHGISAFIYISASHNPVGHNGFKFGLNDGGVLGSSDAGDLISRFRNTLALPAQISQAVKRIHACSRQELQKLLEKRSINKERAYGLYYSFLRRTVSGCANEGDVQTVFGMLRKAAQEHPLGILGELNGSARALSADRKILDAAGVLCRLENDTPGKIVHRIVPEGISLEPASQLLMELHRQESAFIAAYVPDNDGDRGNIVISAKDGTVRALEAQEVFALAVLSELAFHRFLESRGLRYGGQPLAVALNGPSSMRIERIAEAFDAQVFRSEVGEAHVVNLARSKRREGFCIPILGEGSNGGNITHPASVRDPICTIFALLKLLLLRDDEEGPGMFHLWLRALGKEEDYRRDFDLEDILSSLPAFTSTSAYESRAILRLNSFDQGRLKTAWEKLFVKEWKQRKEELSSRFSIADWEAHQYDGIEDRRGLGPEQRNAAGSGGLKVIFLNGSGKARAFIWMRASGTEPVFRILADCEGDNSDLESYLLDWQRSMIEEAYRRIS